MAYSSWSVVANEQPSASKWNILGTNDASFNDGTGIANLAWNVTAVSNPYKFRASRNAAANTGNGAFALVALDTEQFDTNNNHTGGTYTVPVTGFYQFSWSASVTGTAASDTIIAGLFKNGSEISRGAQLVAPGINTIQSTGSDILQLTAADTIDMRAFATATRALSPGANTCYLAGCLMSRT